MAPTCSVVVAAPRGEGDPRRCLEALEDQRHGRQVEIIVVDHGGECAYPAGVLRLSSPGGLVPHLWARGLAEATGEVVAITIARLVPDDSWLDQICAGAGSSEFAAVGGAIEPGPGFTMVDWAAYFCRYAPYMLPIAVPEALEVPGDNAAYRREVLVRYRHVWTDGFWEPFVHRAMKADGNRLAVTPELVARVAPGMRNRPFARQRFQHGRAHGRLRAQGRGPGEALRALLSAPLVPALMGTRAARIVWAKRRHRARFVLASPLILWYYAWWAAGELVGRLAVVRTELSQPDASSPVRP